MAFSDYNLSNVTASTIASKTYRDVSYSFIHPIKGDALVANDLEAIKNSVKNIVFTRIGTRPFFPEFGTNVDNLLFENFDFVTAIALETEIKRGIEKFEPRIGQASIKATPHEETHTYHVRIIFTPYFGGTYSIELVLNRIR